MPEHADPVSPQSSHGRDASPRPARARPEFVQPAEFFPPGGGAQTPWIGALPGDAEDANWFARMPARLRERMAPTRREAARRLKRLAPGIRGTRTVSAVSPDGRFLRVAAADGPGELRRLLACGFRLELGRAIRDVLTDEATLHIRPVERDLVRDLWLDGDRPAGPVRGRTEAEIRLSAPGTGAGEPLRPDGWVDVSPGRLCEAMGRPDPAPGEYRACCEAAEKMALDAAAAGYPVRLRTALPGFERLARLLDTVLKRGGRVRVVFEAADLVTAFALALAGKLAGECRLPDPGLVAEHYNLARPNCVELLRRFAAHPQADFELWETCVPPAASRPLFAKRKGRCDRAGLAALLLDHPVERRRPRSDSVYYERYLLAQGEEELRRRLTAVYAHALCLRREKLGGWARATEEMRRFLRRESRRGVATAGPWTPEWRPGPGAAARIDEYLQTVSGLAERLVAPRTLLKSPMRISPHDPEYVFLIEQEHESRKWLRENGLRILPAWLPFDSRPHLALIGAARMGRFGLFGQAWGESMARSLGNGIEPHLADIYKNSIQILKHLHARHVPARLWDEKLPDPGPMDKDFSELRKLRIDEMDGDPLSGEKG